MMAAVQRHGLTPSTRAAAAAATTTTTTTTTLPLCLTCTQSIPRVLVRKHNGSDLATCLIADV
jgi:hypothetical protein